MAGSRVRWVGEAMVARPRGRRGGRGVGGREGSNGASEGHIEEASGGGEVEGGLAPHGQDSGELSHGGGHPGRQILGLHDESTSPWASSRGPSSQARGTSGESPRPEES